ncbi:MAG: phosphate signaling complex protein PhoU [Spirochaetaceae bacterium]|jgi:phosphate transport system protein|nr:phosphate signaling complex protein PhoU [Spirochaetaceae bacterium]
MRNKFDTQLETLNNDLVAMGALCEHAIVHAVDGLLNNDPAFAREAIEIEKENDRKEREIESLCLKLLLQQQPVARDLRLISSVLKMITDMERIGDQAADIAELARFATISMTHSGDFTRHISQMSAAVIKMVTGSIDAFVKRDISVAEEVIACDNTVDGLFTKIKEDLVALIQKNPAEGGDALEALMVAKYLERIGDHAVNIAEWVEFSITGEHRTGAR